MNYWLVCIALKKHVPFGGGAISERRIVKIMSTVRNLPLEVNNNIELGENLDNEVIKASRVQIKSNETWTVQCEPVSPAVHPFVDFAI